MKRQFAASSILAVTLVAGIAFSATPAAAQGDRGPAAAAGERGGAGGGNAGGGGGGGAAAGGGGGGSAATSGGGGGGGGTYSGSSGSGGSGARAVDRGGGTTGAGGYAVPRGQQRSNDAGRAPIGRSGGADRTAEGTPSGVPSYARPRDGKEPIGTAAPRGTVPGSGGGVVWVPGGYYGGYYDPWWYGGGYIGAYGGYYDPWYGGFPGYPSYPQTTSTPQDEGKLRLKIKPRQAEVYVDGYYSGVVDDFDGLFQRLHLETGTHRIEVRAAGYEPLKIDVRISLDQTTTYEGELKKIQ